MEQNLKEECIKRLEIMEKVFGQHENCLKEFKEDETLYYTERCALGGILYWVKNREDLMQKVKEFEKESNVKVYFCILSETNFGTLFDMLYVSNGEDDEQYWEEEREMLKQGYVISNCKNLTDDMMSDFGEIQIACKNGGIIRIG